MFPVFLNVVGQLVVVVGGGAVGRRKARAATAAGARVRVVALEPAPATRPGEPWEWLAEPYHAGHLEGAVLVFAAAGNVVNATVVADATTRGVWVCDTSDPARGNFLLPGVTRAGQLTVAVSTGGASPSLTRRISEKIRGEFDASFGAWVELLAELRPVIRDVIQDAQARKRIFDEFSDWHWLDRVRREGPDAVRAAMTELIQHAAASGIINRVPPAAG
jgi:precorrin-2 dehydrogenase/sirohydrochlorin ferrochelatase